MRSFKRNRRARAARFCLCSACRFRRRSPPRGRRGAREAIHPLSEQTAVHDEPTPRRVHEESNVVVHREGSPASAPMPMPPSDPPMPTARSSSEKFQIGVKGNHPAGARAAHALLIPRPRVGAPLRTAARVERVVPDAAAGFIAIPWPSFAFAGCWLSWRCSYPPCPCVPIDIPGCIIIPCPPIAPFPPIAPCPPIWCAGAPP